MGCFNSKRVITVDTRAKSKPEQSLVQNKTELAVSYRTFLKYHYGGVPSDYQLNEKIGEGAFAEVIKAFHKPTRQFRAVKRIDKRGLHIDQLTYSSRLKEMQILKDLDHPNILRCYEFFEDHESFYISSEYCGGGEIYDELIKLKKFSEVQAAQIMYQLLSTVAYCHSKRIIHRDLKPENILLAEKSPELFIKVADFGSSNYLDPHRRLNGCFGSAYYIAPEVLSGAYDEKCDVWSCGIIMYIITTGKPPYPGRNENEIIEQAKNRPLQLTEHNAFGLSPEAVQLISRLIVKNPEYRISALEALNHPWFAKYRDSKNAPSLKSSIASLKTFNSTAKLKDAIRLFVATQIITNKDAKELSQNFQSFDLNGDGKVSKHELLEVLRSQGHPNAYSEMEAIMAKVDSDKSGYIDYSEFLKACLEENKHLNKENLMNTFKLFDKDGNGVISAEELKLMLEGEEIAGDNFWTEIIKEVDSNGDGAIDLHEFYSLMTKV